MVTYDLRAASGGTGSPVSPKLVDLVGVHQTVHLELWAQVANLDHDHTNDAFLISHGSFMSSAGGLLGDISNVDAVLPYFRLSHIPVDAVDLDGDGDLDAGSLSPVENADHFFLASDGVVRPHFGDPSALDTSVTDFLIGSLDFAVDSANISGVSTELNYIPRVRTNGPLNTRVNQQGLSDGQFYARVGNDPGVAVGAPVVVRLHPAFPPSVPEPGTVVLLGLGGAGGLLVHGRRLVALAASSSPLKSAVVALFNLAARKTTTYGAILPSHPCDVAAG